MLIAIIVLFIVSAVECRQGSYVRDLDDRFDELKADTPWLLKFYAPWCGHCKKLEPTFEKVAARLDGTGIMVARIDATLYTEVASKYDVRGFPTILYIKKDKVIEYRGDRTEEDLLSFSVRANSPSIGTIHSIGGLQDRLRRPGVFFLYVGDQSGQVYDAYLDAAKGHYLSLDFYVASLSSMKDDVPADANGPFVFVHKDGRRFVYNPLDVASLGEWVDEERFSALQNAKGSAFYDLMAMNKKLVLVAVPPDTNNIGRRVLEVAKAVALDRNLREFQFVHLETTTVISNVVLGSVLMPYAIVFNPVTQIYHLLEKPVHQLNENEWKDYLSGVIRGNIPSYGGTGYFRQIHRALYNLFTSIIDIWYESRLLFCVVIVIPIAVVGLIVFTLCCLDGGSEDDLGPGSDDEDEDEEETPNTSGHLKSE